MQLDILAEHSALTSGVIGGLVGGLLGGLSKFFWERWLPDRLTWKRDQRVRQRQLLATQRDPAVRAINELKSRLWVTLTTNAQNYHYTKSLGRESYYIESTAFLVAQYFAWSEVMRNFIAALDYRDLSSLLDGVSDAFSHGSPGFQFFRLEQREIGELLIAARKADSESAMFRYSDFRELVTSPQPSDCLGRLIKHTRQLFAHLDRESARATRIHNTLVDLLDFVDPDNRWVPTDRRGRLPEDRSSS